MRRLFEKDLNLCWQSFRTQQYILMMGKEQHDDDALPSRTGQPQETS